MSFNRSNTGRLGASVSKNSCSTSSKHWKENITNQQLKIAPSRTSRNLHKSQVVEVNSGSFNKTQPLMPHASELPKNLKQSNDNAKMPLQESRDFKSDHENWLELATDECNTEPKVQMSTFRPLQQKEESPCQRMATGLRFQTSPEQEQAEAAPNTENFDMIRQLISPAATYPCGPGMESSHHLNKHQTAIVTRSPQAIQNKHVQLKASEEERISLPEKVNVTSRTAEDTRTFLEQISFQLRNLPKVTSENSSSCNSTGQAPQHNDLKTLDLSRISHAQQTNFEDEEGFNADASFSRVVQVPSVAKDETNPADCSLITAGPTDISQKQQIKQLALEAQNRPHSEILSDRSIGQDCIRSFRLNLMSFQQQNKAQFDYASLIDRRESAKMLQSPSRRSLKNPSQQASEHRGSLGHLQTHRTYTTSGCCVAGPITSRRGGSIDKNNLASVDQLVAEEEIMGDLVQIVSNQHNDSEEKLQMTSRFKPTRTASVATFGQQGNYNVVGGGQSCTSPTTTTLSPPVTQLDGYWRMEEKQTNETLQSEEQNSVTSKSCSVRRKRQGTDSQSIVNKFITAAQERQNKSCLLTRPILDRKKRKISHSSRSNLRIATQHTECLSSRGKIVGPSTTTSQILNTLKVDNQLLEQSYQKVFQKTENFSSLNFKPSSNALTSIDSQTQNPVRKTKKNKSKKKINQHQQSRDSSTIKKTAPRSKTTRATQQLSQQTQQQQQQQASGVSVKNQGCSFSRSTRFNQNSVNILHSQCSQKNQQLRPSARQPVKSQSVQNRPSRRNTKSPHPKEIEQTVEKKPLRQRASSRKSNFLQQSIVHSKRYGGSRTSSRLSNKSPVIPELELNKSIVSPGVGDLNEDLIKFIDQTEDEREEPALSNLRKYQTRLVYVGNKIDYYAKFVTLRKVREFSFAENPQSTAYLKAGRSLCLLLKAFTCMDVSFRQIKEEELFSEWSKIQQYLNSEQGEKQIKRLPQLRNFCEMHSKFCDKKTLMIDLRRAIFKYTLETDGSLGQIELESPRVKTAVLKPIFCIAFFTMTYITLQEQIRQKLLQLELMNANFVHQQYQNWQEQSSSLPLNNSVSPEKSQGLSCSPDVNQLGIANIAINTTKTDAQNYHKMHRLSAQRHVSDGDQLQIDHFAMLSSTSQPNSFNNLETRKESDQPRDSNVSPISNNSFIGSKDGSMPHSSAYVNQVQRLDMFGSNFKSETPQSKDEFQSRANDTWSRKAANEQLTDYVMQPISSIEHPTSPSLLQQSHSGGQNNTSKGETYQSICSAQGGGLPIQHQLSSRQTDIHTVSNQDQYNSIGGFQMAQGINVSQKRINEMTEPNLQQHSNSQQTSEFTFYQSQRHLLSKLSAQQTSTSVKITTTNGSGDATAQPNNSFQQTFNTQFAHHSESWDVDSPAWQDKQNNVNASCDQQQSPSFSEHRKISNILFEQRNADGINVQELISQVRSSQEFPQIQVPVTQEQHQRLERAFEKFYKQPVSADISAEDLKTTAEEDTIMRSAVEQPSNSWQVLVGDNEKTIIVEEDEDQEGQKNSDDFWAAKRARTPDQILNSIKKRRMNAESRVTGVQLSSLADQIIEQCRIAIERVATPQQQTLDLQNRPDEVIPPESDGSLVQCLLSKKLVVSDTTGGDEESLSQLHVFMSPETPAVVPGSQMKRVFASTENKILGRASQSALTNEDQQRSAAEIFEEEMKVAYHLPAEEAPLEEEVFKTVEALEPKHIQECH